MGSFLLVLLLLLVVFFYILPRLMPHLVKWFLRRQTRRFYRNMTGQDPPKRGAGQKRTTRKERSRTAAKKHERIIPPEYGVDVEYTEVHSYSEDIEIAEDARKDVHIKVEEQVTDAEWTEITETKK